MATPEQRSRAARIAANVSWARTPDRAARTQAAVDASPVRLPYWIAKVRAEGVVKEADISAAAENYRQAHLKRNAKKSAETRICNKIMTTVRCHPGRLVTEVLLVQEFEVTRDVAKRVIAALHEQGLLHDHAVVRPPLSPALQARKEPACRMPAATTSP